MIVSNLLTTLFWVVLFLLNQEKRTMKTKRLLIISLTLISAMHSAFGVDACIRATCSTPATPPLPSNCKRAEWVCATNGTFTTSAYVSCSECNTGYFRAEDFHVYELLHCDHTEGLASMITHVCEKSTTCGSDCVSTAWTSPLGGYQVHTKKVCDNGTCKSSTEFRCDAGWYGSPSTVGSGCTKCPTSNGIAGVTAGPGFTAITNCFLPAGTAFSDTTGSGVYSSPCYWN